MLWRLLFVILFASQAYADTKIAFLELRTYDGKILQLEPNGRFAHVAISYGDKWLHAHPLRGVELVNLSILEKVGKIKAVVSVSVNSLSDNAVKRFLGKPYDSQFSWTDEGIYCSELIAKLLGIAPKPMRFRGPYWPAEYRKREGEPGISPDELARMFGV